MEKGKDVEIITMKTKHGEGIQFMKYEDDVILPQKALHDPVKKMKAIFDLKHKKGDVLLCTFSKCGTHWVGNMTRRLMDADTDHDNFSVMLLELNSLEDISSLASPRLLMTHLWPKRLPMDHVINNHKVVLLLRNPKDVAVSYYYHLKNAVAVSNKQTWDEFLASYLEGSVPFGSYFDYLEAWIKELSGKVFGLNTEVFFYEDFIVDCFEQLKRLAKFLGLERSDEDLRKIADGCSFENLKATAMKVTDENRGTRNKDGHSVIYRKGEVGDWTNHFTVAQNEQFDAILEANEVAKGFNFKYAI